MKPIRYKSLLLPLLAAVLVLLNTSRVFGYVNTAYPDSVTISSAVGSSAEAYILIYDGQDSMSNLPKGTVSMYINGSSEFGLMTDSIVQFIGETTVRVRYSPTSLSGSWATLVIVGDSNTLHVTLVGNPISHFQPQLSIGNYDSLTVNQQFCQNFGIDNTNSDTIWIESVRLTQNGSSWSLNDMATLPMAIPGYKSLTIGQLCALWVLADSEQLFGGLTVVYNYSSSVDSVYYGSGTDSVGASLQAEHRPVQTSCITSTGGDFGAVAEGSSVTNSIFLTNVTDTDVYLDSTQIAGTDYSQFTINSPSFPLVIHPDSSVSVSITFTAPNPSTQDNYSGLFESSLYGMSQDGMPCNSLYVALMASISIPVVDSITLDVPPGTSTLSFTAHTSLSRHAIFIHNAGTSNLLIETLAIDDTSGVAFFGSQGIESTNVYDSLGAGATSSSPILLTLDAPDTGTYNIDLTLTYETQGTHKQAVITGSSKQEYTIVAHRLPPAAAGVSESLPQVADFSLNPNPASGEVTISLPQDGNSTVEIYDILGNLILRKQAMGQYIWSGETPGGIAATGAYIVRVTERETNGAMAVSSKRLIFQR